MRGLSLSFFLLCWMSCTSCCCCGIPTFGLWPDVDEAEIEAAVRNAPIVVDHLCERGETCTAVEGAKVEVFPIAWSPITGEATVGVQVEATCRDAESGGAQASHRRAIVCAGVLGAVVSGGTVSYVTEDTRIFQRPSGKTLEEWEATTGDMDWD